MKKTTKKEGRTRFTRGSGDVFADLNVARPENAVTPEEPRPEHQHNVLPADGTCVYCGRPKQGVSKAGVQHSDGSWCLPGQALLLPPIPGHTPFLGRSPNSSRPDSTTISLETLDHMDETMRHMAAGDVGDAFDSDEIDGLRDDAERKPGRASQNSMDIRAEIEKLMADVRGARSPDYARRVDALVQRISAGEGDSEVAIELWHLVCMHGWGR